MQRGNYIDSKYLQINSKQFSSEIVWEQGDKPREERAGEKKLFQYLSKHPMKP